MAISIHKYLLFTNKSDKSNNLYETFKYFANLAGLRPVGWLHYHY